MQIFALLATNLAGAPAFGDTASEALVPKSSCVDQWNEQFDGLAGGAPLSCGPLYDNGQHLHHLFCLHTLCPGEENQTSQRDQGRRLLTEFELTTDKEKGNARIHCAVSFVEIQGQWYGSSHEFMER